MTESHVEQQVQQRIQAARVRVAAAKERRTSLAEARKAGLARRHAAKLLNLRDSEQRRLDDEPDEDDDGRQIRHAMTDSAPGPEPVEAGLDDGQDGEQDG